MENLTTLQTELQQSIDNLKKIVKKANLSEKLIGRPFSPLTVQEYIDMWRNDENSTISDLIERFNRESSLIKQDMKLDLCKPYKGF